MMPGSSISLGGFVLLMIYFVPAIVAALRNHHNKDAIFLTNLLLGWTVLGWIVALIWSATATYGSLANVINNPQPPRLTQPNIQPVQSAATPRRVNMAFVIFCALLTASFALALLNRL